MCSYLPYLKIHCSSTHFLPSLTLSLSLHSFHFPKSCFHTLSSSYHQGNPQVTTMSSAAHSTRTPTQLPSKSTRHLSWTTPTIHFPVPMVGTSWQQWVLLTISSLELSPPVVFSLGKFWLSLVFFLPLCPSLIVVFFLFPLLRLPIPNQSWLILLLKISKGREVYLSSSQLRLSALTWIQTTPPNWVPWVNSCPF